MNILRFFTIACATIVTGSIAVSAAQKVVIIAGPLDKGHPQRTHEYEKSAKLLKHCLDTSPNLRGVETEVHFNGWPDNASALDQASTIVVMSSGSDRKAEDHPLLGAGRLSVIDRQMKRGCGLVMLHWSTFMPLGEPGYKMLEWTGGHFDYQSGKDHPQGWASRIQHFTATSKPGAPNHPISRGVTPFEMHEEYYYRLRFRENDPRLKPIILTRPPGETEDQIVAWAVERADGGRGFGTTGGHYYDNWWNEDFRKLILNAIVWTARADVPSEGVSSKLFAQARTLVVTGHNHPAHNWKETTAALKDVLGKDARFTIDVSEDPEALGQRDLRDVDLVVLNYCNWERPGLSPIARQNFQRYLDWGGAVALIHFANGAFHFSLPKTAPADDWPEFRNISRRVWDHGQSGHDAYGRFTVQITPAKHPIIEQMSVKSFEAIDELYFKQAGDQPIEPLATARSKVTGKDEPMAWAHAYGRGRVFQTVLGHAAESIRAPGVAELIWRGSVWAAGLPQKPLPPAEPQLIDVRRIWDAAPHNAFTDLLHVNGTWFCAFREGQGHVSPDGAIRVLKSADGEAWASAALIKSDTADLRDPKLTLTSRGELMLSTAGALHQPASAKHQSYVWFSRDGAQWGDAIPVGDPNMWLWRMTWHNGAAYSIGYDTTAEKFVRLYSSRDGRSFEPLVARLFDEGYPNESSIVFQPDETAVCLLRRDGTPASGKLGSAKPPYTTWAWRDLGVKIGGPHMLRLPDGRFIAAVRLYDGAVRTSLAWVDPVEARLTECVKLPSGGDSSYAGLVLRDGVLWVSYYSSHEGKTSIYLARVRVPPRN